MAFYGGGNVTRAADVAIDQAAPGAAVVFHAVAFEARPLTSPQYYGIRFGRWLGQTPRIGLEAEFIHMKAYAEVGRVYAVTDRRGTNAVPPGTPMSSFVQQYSMSHDLNFLLVNVVVRRPLGAGPGRLDLRFGAGPTLPHAESSVAGVSRGQYEYAGLGTQVAAGVDWPLFGRFSALAEYKFTWARPEIDIANGTTRAAAAVAVARRPAVHAPGPEPRPRCPIARDAG